MITMRTFYNYLDLIILSLQLLYFSYIAIACFLLYFPFLLSNLPTSLSVPISLSFSLIIYLRIMWLGGVIATVFTLSTLSDCMLLCSMFYTICYLISAKLHRVCPNFCIFLSSMCGQMYYSLFSVCFKFLHIIMTLYCLLSISWFLPFLIGYILLQCFCFVAPYSARCTHLFFMYAFLIVRLGQIVFCIFVYL